MPPSPDPNLAALFAAANLAAISGWIALGLAQMLPRWAGRAELYAGRVLPVALGGLYAGLILSFWSGAEGGFASLPEVMALFETPGVALAGWVHYLGFDLVVGAWASATGRAERVPAALMLPVLLLTFLFGPAGFLAFMALRAARRPLALKAM